MISSVWVPESPHHPGLYANLKDRDRGKLASGPAVSTFHIHSARQFPTREACLAWCLANRSPVFEPREHRFSDAIDPANSE